MSKEHNKSEFLFNLMMSGPENGVKITHFCRLFEMNLETYPNVPNYFSTRDVEIIII